jgi:23S rRNA pseudouridine1911/1915/1917 synthase
LSTNKPIKRIYQAVVSGLLPFSSGTIDAPIARHPNSIIERIVSPNGKNAITTYKVICQSKDACLAEIELLTGRTHQIRVHMSYINHPLLGDDLYGGNCTLINRQALHAARIIFTHPITHKLIDLSSSLPADMVHLIKLLNFI